MLKANFHTHTSFCDGSSTPEEMVQEAIRLGFLYLGFSSHIDIDPVIDIPAYLNEIRRLQEKYKDQIQVLCGGELDNMYADRNPKGFDYLIGSVHHMLADGKVLAVDWKEDDIHELLRVYGDGYTLSRKYFEIIAETYGKGKCDFIGHFDLITRHNDRFHFIDEEDERYLKPAFEVLEYLAGEELPIEINTGKSHIGRIYPSEIFLKKWKELKGEILINSDAHNRAELMNGFDAGIKIAIRCGFDHTNILVREGDINRYFQIALN
jgi:histidinol-phosphatase (PHP family)